MVYRHVRAAGSAALPVIMKHLASPHPWVREAVVRSLSILGWRAGAVLPELRARAEAGTAHERETATIAIEVIRARRKLDARTLFPEAPEDR